MDAAQRIRRAARSDPKAARHIECRDAILSPEGGEPEWPQADVVIGNPPFLGGKLLNAHLGEEYVRAFSVCMKAAYRPRRISFATGS